MLHVGCTDEPLTLKRIESDSLLHGKLLQSASYCLGMDIDYGGLKVLKKAYPNSDFVHGSAEQMDLCPEAMERKWEVVVAADVVEHLNNVGLFFQTVKMLMGPDTDSIITVPHAFSVKRFVWLLTGQEHVHPDHTAYFSVANFKQIALRHGFSVKEVFGFQWRHHKTRNFVANFISSPMVWLSRGRYCDEIAVVLRRAK